MLSRSQSLKRKELIFIGSYSMIAHVLSFLRYNEIKSEDIIFYLFQWDFLFLLSLSLILSQVLIWGGRLVSSKTSCLLIIQWILILMLGLPLGKELYIEAILISDLILQSIFFIHRRIYTLILVSLELGSFILIQQKVKYDGYTVPPPSIDSTLIQTFFILVMAFLFLWIKKFQIEILSLYQEIRRLKQASGKLIKANRNFQEKAYEIESVTIKNERMTMSREIHDIVGYAMVNINMMMEDAMDQIDDSSHPVFSLVLNSRDLARSSHLEIRRILQAFRDRPDTGATLINEISNLITVFSRASGIQITLKTPQTLPKLTNEHRYQITKIIKESLTNALFHGQAQTMQIFILRHCRGITILIEDDGIGATMITEGIGISGIRERLKDMSGRLDLDFGAGFFKLIINIPIASQGEAV